MKRFLPLVLILSVLLLIAVLLELPRRRSVRATTALLNVDTSLAARVSIGGPAGELSLEASGEGWKVVSGKNEYPADSGRVASMLRALGSLKGELVSFNPENQAIFGVDQDGGSRVELRSQKDSVLACLFVGNPDRDFTHTYIRGSSSNDVYSVAGFLKSYIRSEVEFWRRRTILSFDESELDTFKLLYPGLLLSFARDTLGGMTLTHPKRASFDTSVVKQAIRALSRLNATGFDDDATPEESGFRLPQLKVILIMNTGDADTLLVGRLKDRSYYVNRLGDPAVYLVSKHTVERFFRDRESYLAG